MDIHGQERPGERGFALEEEVVIPGDQHLVFVRLFGKPLAEGTNLGFGAAHGEVACVDEATHHEGPLLIVRVGDKDEAHRAPIMRPCRFHRQYAILQ